MNSNKSSKKDSNDMEKNKYIEICSRFVYDGNYSMALKIFTKNSHNEKVALEIITLSLYDNYNKTQDIMPIIRIYKIIIDDCLNNDTYHILIKELTKFLVNNGFTIEVINILSVNNSGYKISWYPSRKLTINKECLKMIGYKNFCLIIDKIKNPTLFHLGTFFWLEGEEILKSYKHIDFEQFPEISMSLKSLEARYNGLMLFNNYQKFSSFIEKMINIEKVILALHILQMYGFYNKVSDAKLLCDNYINIFVKLDRYDILSNYYERFDILKQNIEFIQHIVKYYISKNQPISAEKSLKYIALVEPKHPFIDFATLEINKLHMINKLLSEDINFSIIDNMTGKEFEDLLIKKFIFLGFNAKGTPASGDFGADILVETKNGTRFIIQCKRFKNKVNLKAVQEVVAAISHYNGDIGIVITNNGFLTSAISLAESNQIELWDNYKLMSFLSGNISFSQINEL